MQAGAMAKRALIGLALASTLGACTGDPASPANPTTPAASAGGAASQPLRTAEPPEATSAPPADPAAQRSLTVEPADVSAPMTSVSVTSGVLEPPSGALVWVKSHDRVAPGELGTAVVAGHVVSRGKPDVFGKLHLVKTGDTFQISKAGSSSPTTFRVTQAFTVDKRELSTMDVAWGPNSDVRRVVLVTCDDALGFHPDGHRVANFVVVGEAV